VDPIEAVSLAPVQGLTEFLPVSSSHMIVMPYAVYRRVLAAAVIYALH